MLSGNPQVYSTPLHWTSHSRVATIKPRLSERNTPTCKSATKLPCRIKCHPADASKPAPKASIAANRKLRKIFFAFISYFFWISYFQSRL